jgi:hypothetical protein
MVGGASMFIAALALQRVPEAASTQTV